MATANHINFLKLNIGDIKEPILIIGSKQYEFDEKNIRKYLEKNGFTDITGIDIIEGEGVDRIVDIIQPESEFIKTNRNVFSTVICMEILTHVKNPFVASKVITTLLKKGGMALLSECFIRKISKIPIDFWRFTYDGMKELFSDLTFDDSKAKVSYTRDKKQKLFPLIYPLPEILNARHNDESEFGYFLRRLHRKYFAKGIFKLSRLMPETTIYSIAKK